MTERTFLGVVEVDSGTLVVGDPGYLLPRASTGAPGVDYQHVLDGLTDNLAERLAGEAVLLLQNFGGDGPYAVYAEYEDGEVARICIDLEPIELEDEEDES